MFNLYSLSSVWEAISNLLFHYSLLPLVLIVWLLALRTRAFTLAAGAGLVWATVLTPAYVTTPVALTDSVLFAGVVLVELAGTGQCRERIRILLCGATTYGVWVLFSLFWIVPLGLYSSAVEARGLEAGDPTGLFHLNSVPLGKALGSPATGA